MLHLTDEQLKAMMTDKDELDQNVLALAAGSGNKYAFDSTLAAAENLFSPSEVRYPLRLIKCLTLYSMSDSCLRNIL